MGRCYGELYEGDGSSNVAYFRGYHATPPTGQGIQCASQSEMSGTCAEAGVHISMVVKHLYTGCSHHPNPHLPITTSACQTLACTAVTAVRLVNGSNTAEGRLEVRIGGLWGTVSAMHYGSSDAVAQVGRMMPFLLAVVPTYLSRPLLLPLPLLPLPLPVLLPVLLPQSLCRCVPVLLAATTPFPCFAAGGLPPAG